MMRWSVMLFFAACAEAPPASDDDEWDKRLGERVVDENAALRIAALRLTGDLPTLAEIESVANAPDRRAAYSALVGSYLVRPQFAVQMFRFAQDMLKMGDDPQLDSAAAFVAQVIVADRSYLDVLTATSGTCPRFDPATATFTPGECANGSPATVGLLTHPGVQAHLFSNLAFRRVRWLQETFACTRFPAELAASATDVGGVTPYTGTFPFASIAGAASGGRVDFRDTSSVICANCHSNMNHIAPLFAHYDSGGQYSMTFAVPVPLPESPPAEMRDYLPPGELMAWRFSVPVADMTALARAMAADPDIAECAIARVWNWALGKPDIVDGSARVPTATIEHQVAAFIAGNYNLRDAIYGVFTSDDFVRF